MQYSYRPTIFSEPQFFFLEGEELQWRVGTGTLEQAHLSEVASLIMSGYGRRGARCWIRLRDGRKLTLVGLPSPVQMLQFAAFIMELHDKLLPHAEQVDFRAGGAIASASGGVLSGLAVMIGVMGGAVRHAGGTGDWPFIAAGALLAVGIVLLLLGRPQPYDPTEWLASQIEP